MMRQNREKKKEEEGGTDRQTDRKRQGQKPRGKKRQRKPNTESLKSTSEERLKRQRKGGKMRVEGGEGEKEVKDYF